MGALEALSGELACKHITDKQLDAIRKKHMEMVRFYKCRDLSEYFEANQAIHQLILEAAKNSELTIAHQSLATRVRRARYLANMTEERWKKAVEEHEDILKALEERNGPELGEILRLHLANKFETVRQWLNSKQSEA